MAMTPNEMITVLRHFETGGKVQFRIISRVPDLDWQDAVSPIWNFDEFEYRIKPKPLELWVNLYPDGTSSPYETKKEALAAKKDYAEARTVHMREVTDE